MEAPERGTTSEVWRNARRGLMIAMEAPGAQARQVIGVTEMSIARTIASRVDEFRLRQARAETHRAMLEFLRADWFDDDTDPPAHRVALASARAEALEAAIRRDRPPRSPRPS